MKRIVLPFFLLLLCGCSRMDDGTRLLPVSAIAIGQTESGYCMTAEIIRQDSLDGDAAPVYLEAQGSSPEELFRNADLALG